MAKLRKQNYFFLNVDRDGDGVQVSFHVGRTGRMELLRTKLDYLSFFQQAAKRLGISRDSLVVMCSSSLDFPEDYTTDRETLALCDWIRSGGAADEAAERDDA